MTKKAPAQTAPAPKATKKVKKLTATKKKISKEDLEKIVGGGQVRPAMP
jgi:hypothetical protein